MKYRVWVEIDGKEWCVIYLEIEEDVYEFLTKAFFIHFENIEKYKDLAGILYEINNSCIRNLVLIKEGLDLEKYRWRYHKDTESSDIYHNFDEEFEGNFYTELYPEDSDQEILDENLRYINSYGIVEKDLLEQVKEFIKYEEIVFITY